MSAVKNWLEERDQVLGQIHETLAELAIQAGVAKRLELEGRAHALVDKLYEIDNTKEGK